MQESDPPNVSELMKVCEQYFQLFEPNDLSLHENFKLLYQSLCELNYRFSQLEEVDCDDSEVERMDYNCALEIVVPNFKGANYYPKPLDFVNFRVHENMTEVENGCGNAIDDIADIYTDLLEGYDLVKAGHPQGALWQWHFNYRYHFADHILWLQIYLHEELTQ